MTLFNMRITKALFQTARKRRLVCAFVVCYPPPPEDRFSRVEAHLRIYDTFKALELIHARTINKTLNFGKPEWFPDTEVCDRNRL